MNKNNQRLPNEQLSHKVIPDINRQTEVSQTVCSVLADLKTETKTRSQDETKEPVENRNSPKLDLF